MDEYKVDGDMVNYNILYTKESIEEINNMLNDVEYYVTPDNKMTYSVSTGPLDYVLAHMTKFR